MGTPPTECTCVAELCRAKPYLTRDIDTLILDTGSANTWVGASKAYVVTGTSEDTGEPVVSIAPSCVQSRSMLTLLPCSSLSLMAQAPSLVSHKSVVVGCC